MGVFSRARGMAAAVTYMAACCPRASGRWLFRYPSPCGKASFLLYTSYTSRQMGFKKFANDFIAGHVEPILSYSGAGVGG